MSENVDTEYLENRLDEIQAQVSRLDNKFTALSNNFTELRGEVNNLETLVEKRT